MTDRDLLEAAARAAGIDMANQPYRDSISIPLPGDSWKDWNPLADDGDALRLAVKLGVIVDVRYDGVNMDHNCVCYWLPGKGNAPYSREWFVTGDDLCAATRRAIVRAAAAMAAQGQPKEHGNG